MTKISRPTKAIPSTPWEDFENQVKEIQHLRSAIEGIEHSLESVVKGDTRFILEVLNPHFRVALSSMLGLQTLQEQLRKYKDQLRKELKWFATPRKVSYK